MAYTDATIMQQYILKSQNVLDNYEGMRGIHGAFAMGREMVARGIAPLSEIEVQQKFANYKNLPKVAVINDDGVTITTERVTVSTATTLGTSAFVDISRATIQGRFKVVPSNAGGNAVTNEDMQMRLIAKCVNDMKNAADLSVITAIEAAKSQFSSATFPMSFDLVSDSFQSIVPAGITKLSEKNDVWIDGVDATNTNFMTDGLSQGVVATLGSPYLSLLLKYGNRYGAANSKNLSNVAEGQIFYVSSNISQNTQTPKDRATIFNLLPYSFGTYIWTGSDAREGRVGDNGKTRLVFIPELGANVEMFEKNTFEDQSALNGSYKAAYTDEIRLAFDIINVSAYYQNPTTVAGPIHKVVMIDNV